ERTGDRRAGQEEPVRTDGSDRTNNSHQSLALRSGWAATGEGHVGRHGAGSGRHYSGAHHHAAEENYRAKLAAMDHGVGRFSAGQLHGAAANHSAAAGPAPDSLGAG